MMLVRLQGDAGHIISFHTGHGSFQHSAGTWCPLLVRIGQMLVGLHKIADFHSEEPRVLLYSSLLCPPGSAISPAGAYRGLFGSNLYRSDRQRVTIPGTQRLIPDIR